MTQKPLKNPWARHEGNLVHISTLDSALLKSIRKDSAASHHFICPREGCGDVLFPRALNSSERRPHFVHLNLDCDLSRESMIHLVAKTTIMERRHLWLPALRSSPSPPYGATLHPPRDMLCSNVTPEAFVLGRWRADVELVDHPGPFAIFDEEGEPVLLVEIVVTSPVSAEKVEAVQRAGMKMIAIQIDQDAVEDGNLQSLVVEDAPREWLAHPAWMEERQAEWDERDRLERVARAAEEDRVRDVLERIATGRPPEWQPRRQATLERLIEDHDLTDVVGLPVEYGHWMAGDPKWWQASLLKTMMYDRIRLGRGPKNVLPIPAPEECLEAVAGFVIPFAKDESDPRILSVVGVGENGWGSPTLAIAAYLKKLVEAGFARRGRGCTRPDASRHAIGFRHREINEHLLLFLESDTAASTSEERVFSWKSEPFSTRTRRAAIIEGGYMYAMLLQKTRLEAAEARRVRLSPHWLDDPDADEPARAPTRLVSAYKPGEEQPRILAAVREGRSVSARTPDLFSGYDAIRQEDELRHNYRPQPRPAFQRTAEPQRPASPTASPPSPSRQDAGRWQATLETRLVKGYRRNATRSKAEQMATLFLNGHHPKLGGRRPIDVCVDEMTMGECERIAGIR